MSGCRVGTYTDDRDGCIRSQQRQVRLDIRQQTMSGSAECVPELHRLTQQTRPVARSPTPSQSIPKPNLAARLVECESGRPFVVDGVRDRAVQVAYRTVLVYLTSCVVLRANDILIPTRATIPLHCGTNAGGYLCRPPDILFHGSPVLRVPAVWQTREPSTMERSMSVASSSTAASRGPQHTRNASSATKVQRHGVRPTGLAAVSLFVTNLRLLNLDQLPDWPGITVASLGNQDARARVRNTEFALYQLFRLQDPATTAEKLQPFFPPLEPLQSINLRAALYRCLNELKKNGVLGKETVLRKTMLDECQGEKFWDACLCFSAVVLRKVTMERRSRYGRPQAERLGMVQTPTVDQRESMLPLAVAHKAALFKVLEDKQKKKQTYGRLYDVLVQKEDDLWQRRAKAEDDARRRMSDPQFNDFNDMERDLKKVWIGSPELQNALINGDDCMAGDDLLVRPLDELWCHDGQADQQGESQGGLLSSLEEKVRSQAQRLRKWQGLHEKYLASKTSSKHKTLQLDTGLEHLQFDRHSNLKVRDDAETNGERAHARVADAPKHASATRYDDVLTAMREELRRTRKGNAAATNATTAAVPPLQRSKTTAVHASRKPSVHLDTGAGVQHHHQRSPSLTAVPVRPGMGRRVPSRSRSYAQPKVDSQRQPIPLKAELFSPLKNNVSPLRTSRRSSASPSSFSSMMPSPVEEGVPPEVSIDEIVSNDMKRASQGTFDSGVGLGFDNLTSSDSSNESSDAAPEIFRVPLVPPAKPQSNGRASRPSLAERARMSMAFTSAEEISGLLPEPQVAEDTPSKAPSLPSTVDDTSDPSRPTTLLERTRQSISLAPQQPAALSRKKSSHTRSRTSIYPVNQFDTPKKLPPRRSSLDAADEADEQKRNITPHEQLFSPDAEYDSVFKPRPKVAFSPVQSPAVAMDSEQSFFALENEELQDSSS
nr:hypothetical protein CFP56_11028 [Quercus suber]